ncbi:MAG: DRTGG domain-containing protein [Fusobacteriota bacterium]
MRLSEISKILDAKVITCEDKIDNIEIKAVGAADMMSEVLAFSKEGALLLTGLITPQVIRTAQMMDLEAIMFVRGKMPKQDTIDLSNKVGIPMLVTDKLLYPACGKLYEQDIPSC